MITDERLELPAEFDGLPESTLARAQARAESMLPGNLAAQLGQTSAEQTLVSATCHVLAMTGAGTGERPRGAVTDWTATAYGSEVAETLALLGKPNGRARAFPMHSAE